MPDEAAQPESSPAPIESHPPLISRGDSGTFSEIASPSGQGGLPHRFDFNVGMMMQTGRSAPDPIAEKMDATHITQLIANSREESKQRWIDGLMERGQIVMIVLAVLVFVGLVCNWTIAKGQYEIAKEVIIGFLAFVAGYGTKGAVEKRPHRAKAE